MHSQKVEKNVGWHQLKMDSQSSFDLSNDLIVYFSTADIDKPQVVVQVDEENKKAALMLSVVP